MASPGAAFVQCIESHWISHCGINRGFFFFFTFKNYLVDYCCGLPGCRDRLGEWIMSVLLFIFKKGSQLMTFDIKCLQFNWQHEDPKKNRSCSYQFHRHHRGVPQRSVWGPSCFWYLFTFMYPNNVTFIETTLLLNHECHSDSDLKLIEQEYVWGHCCWVTRPHLITLLC